MWTAERKREREREREREAGGRGRIRGFRKMKTEFPQGAIAAAAAIKKWHFGSSEALTLL